MITSVVTSELINIELFTNEQIRECMKILNTRRSFYFRLLLTITYYLIHENIDRIIFLIFNKTSIENHTEFEGMLNDMMIETIITITGYIIKMDHKV